MSSHTTSNHFPKFYCACLHATLMLLATSTLAHAGNEAVTIKLLVGTWSTSTIDKETGDTETTVIEFKPNGTYSTRLSSKQFGEVKNSASGRFAVGDAEKDTFTLKIEALKGDPEMDKNNAVMTAKIRQIDVNTLQSEDGQIVRRVK
jgi:hypothetical protein